MSRTYKKFPRVMLRGPKGRRNAIIHGARHGSVPPDPYDDINLDSHCSIPYRAARNMQSDGRTREEVVEKLRKKFRFTFHEAMELTEWIFY